jgi:hypothetical protein
MVSQGPAIDKPRSCGKTPIDIRGTFAARSALNNGSKRAIGRLAASLVEPDDTIVTDVGTTARRTSWPTRASWRRGGPPG